MTGIYALQLYLGYCFFLALPRAAFALYYVNGQVQAQLIQRASVSVFTRNDSTLYMYGGFLKSHVQNNRSIPGGMPATNVFDAISIDPHDGKIHHIVLPPGDAKVGLSQAVVFPNHVLFIGGYCQDCFNASQLFLSQYLFDQQRWDAPPAYGPVPPQGIVSATLADDGKVYIRYQQDHPNDFWSYDPFSGQFENLSVTLSPRDRYTVHFSWKLPDGNVAFLAENDVNHNYSLDLLLVYNTSARAWNSQHIGAKNQQHKSIPQNKRYFGITNDQSSKKIYLYGGVAVNPPFGGYSDLKVLDTSTWTWESPHYAGAPPRSQYRHAMKFINENTLVLIGGIISSLWELRVDKTTPFLAKGDFWCDHINVLQVSNTTAEWVTNITHNHTIDKSISSSPSAYFVDPRAIVVIVMGSVLAITLFLLLYIFRRRIIRITAKIFRVWIWSPRIGEPKWTEIYRLAFKIILGCSLTGLLAVNISYALNSPLVTINYITQVNEVVVPDIRICIRDTGDAFLMCETETLSAQVFNEMGFIRELNTSLHRPAHIGRSDEARCYMFAPSEWFRLTRSGHVTTHNGSRLLLRLRYSIGDTATNSPNIYLSLYARGRNPNRQVYYNEKQQMTQEELRIWLDQEKFDIHQENQYTLGVATYSMINFQHLVEETLVNSRWNTIGFASDYHTALKLKTEIRAEAVDPLERGIRDDNSSILFDTAVILYPTSFMELQTRQQKIHTFITLLGVMGGALALLTTCMVVLFGARPSSPWGFVQQMSAGNTRRSLITDLQRQFHPWAMGSIPFVDAVVPPRSAVEKELLDRQAVRYRISHNDGTTTIPSTGQPRRNNSNNGHSIIHNNGFGIYETADKGSHSMATDDALEQLIQKHVRAEIDRQFGTTQPVQDIHCRLQLMELVFKCYYIDHEVFSKLALAMQGDLDVPFCHTQEWVNSFDHNSVSPHGTRDMLGGKSSVDGETRKEGLFKSLLNFFNTGVNHAENADQEESAVMQRLTMNYQAPPNIRNNTK